MKLYFNSKSVYIHVSTSVAFFCTFICRGLYCISFIHVRIARCTLSSMLCYLRLWTVHHNSYQDSRDTSSCQALGSECVRDRVTFKPRLNTPWCIEKSISIEHEIDHSPAGHTQGSSHHDSISGIRREANYAVFFYSLCRDFMVYCWLAARVGVLKWMFCRWVNSRVYKLALKWKK